MPALTKKKTKKKVSRVRSSDTGRAKKGRNRTLADHVSDFARDHKSTLNALGWVFASPAMAAKAAAKARDKSDAARKTSKGGRGTEKYNKGKGRNR